MKKGHCANKCPKLKKKGVRYINTIQFIMSDKLNKPEFLTTYEQINIFYDYKSNTNILRSSQLSKYPRFLCGETAKS